MTEGYNFHHFDFDSLPWLTSPRRHLGLQGVALGLIKIPPDEGYSFTHRHREQEEVYVVIDGTGSMLVGDDLLDLIRGDIVRVSASTRRALKAGPQGLFVVCAGAVPMGFPRNPGARYLIDDGIPDYSDVPPWYRDDPSIIQKNEKLRQRMLAAQEKREAGRGPGTASD